MRDALKTLAKLREEMKLAYDVSYECTHHGPSLSTPTMFVELGSSLEQWKDLKAAEAVAHATIQSISEFRKSKATVAIGIGGTHYNAKFTKMALEKEIAFSHMIPKHAIQHINTEILKQCVNRTLEKVEYAVLDWKGIKSEHKPKTISMLKEINLPIQKT